MVQLNALLGDARTSLKKVDAVLVEAQAVGANVKDGTSDLNLLRGEVESIAAGHVQFRSGLETLLIPLDRLAAIVTPLPSTKTDAPITTNGSLIFVTLNSGGRVGLIFEAIRDGALVGKHPLVGPCAIPLFKVARIDTQA